MAATDPEEDARAPRARPEVPWPQAGAGLLAPRAFPQMHLNPAVADLFAFGYEDFTVDGYDPHPAIKAPVAV